MLPGLDILIPLFIMIGPRGTNKPAKLNVLHEDFEPLSWWVAKRFQQKYGIEVAFTSQGQALRAPVSPPAVAGPARAR